MKALVTGATGFVGTALAQRLLDENASVHVLVRDPARAEDLRAAGAKVFVGSICDPNKIALAAADCEVLFHCAGENSHRAAPRALQWINVAGTENTINAARHAGCKRVVHLSCADTTLTNQDRLHWKEDRICIGQPLGECARSKLLAEELALAASCQSTEVTAIRAAWVWGPGDHTVLPVLCREAESGGVRLYGNGRNLISTLYIDNLIHALLAASEAPNVACNAYYVTDGEFLDAGEFVGMLCQSVGLPPPRPGVFFIAYAAAWIRERLKLEGPWTIDVVRRARGSLFDIQCAAKDLDYAPQVSLAEGMQRLGDWVGRVGGPQAVARLAREPTSIQSVETEARSAVSRAAGDERDAEPAADRSK